MLALALALVTSVAWAAPASAHGGAANESASELVLQAIAILEAHPAPQAAVDDKIRDAQKASDQRGVRADLVRAAGKALGRGDVVATKRLLEQAVGTCPDPDILYVSDQRARPPCLVPAHTRAVPRRSIGGTSEVVILIVAAVLALAGFAIIRHPHVSAQRERGTP